MKGKNLRVFIGFLDSGFLGFKQKYNNMDEPERIFHLYSIARGQREQVKHIQTFNAK
jgi:hypothetical protein